MSKGKSWRGATHGPGVLKTMAPRAALDPTQATLVAQYLQAHARGQ